MYHGCDTAARLTLDDYKYLKKNGMNFVMRYFVPDSMSKSLTSDEVNSAHAAGIALGLVYETTANRALQGHPAGVADAKTVNGLINKFRPPHGTAIYFAVDCDVPPAQHPIISAYFMGIKSELDYRYKIGVYGGRRILGFLEACSDTCTHYWSAYAWKYGIVGKYNISQLTASTPFGHLVIDHDEASSLKGFWEGKMTGEEIYSELKRYLDNVDDTAVDDPAVKKLLDEARKLNIYDGSRPMGLCHRYEAAIMALRAYDKALSASVGADRNPDAVKGTVFPNAVQGR